MQKFKSEILALGLWQLIGGGIGFILIILFFLSSADISSISILLVVFMSLFFLYSIFCGILCLRMKPAALIYSLINQFFQLINFVFSGFAFMYAAGIYITIGIDLSKSFEITFGGGLPAFLIQVSENSVETLININLIALAMIFWIKRLRVKIKSENNTTAVSSIGQN